MLGRLTMLRGGALLTAASLLALATASRSNAAAKSPTWLAISSPANSAEALQVVQYLDFKGNAKGQGQMVVINAGSQQGIIEGMNFKAMRASTETKQLNPQAEPIWIETGRLKAMNVQGSYTIARVEEQSSDMAQMFFPKFPTIMAGDQVTRTNLEISRRQVFAPTIELSYFDLFEDPKQSPQSFELKAEAWPKLRAAVQAFAQARLSLLMIEAYTDSNGSAQANQVESFQRAQAIRRFLIDELGFDEQRVVAIGYGELEPADNSHVSGYITANRRIVFKAIPMQAEMAK